MTDPNSSSFPEDQISESSSRPTATPPRLVVSVHILLLHITFSYEPNFEMAIPQDPPSFKLRIFNFIKPQIKPKVHVGTNKVQKPVPRQYQNVVSFESFHESNMKHQVMNRETTRNMTNLYLSESLCLPGATTGTDSLARS